MDIHPKFISHPSFFYWGRRLCPPPLRPPYAAKFIVFASTLKLYGHYPFSEELTKKSSGKKCWYFLVYWSHASRLPRIRREGVGLRDGMCLLENLDSAYASEHLRGSIPFLSALHASPKKLATPHTRPLSIYLIPLLVAQSANFSSSRFCGWTASSTFAVKRNWDALSEILSPGQSRRATNRRRICKNAPADWSLTTSEWSARLRKRKER